MSDDLKYQILLLGKQIEISGQAINRLERQLRDARQLIVLMEQEKKQRLEQRVLQDQIIKQQLATSDETVRKLQDEILELRARLKAA